MNIWIDLANSPHVWFFLPIIEQLSKNNKIFITLRRFSQTVDLANNMHIAGSIIGKHGGRGRVSKLFNLLNRSRQLTNFSKGKRIDIALSHNSYTQVIAGRLCRAKVITFMDYEGQPANHIAFRIAHRIIVPYCFPDKALRKYGANPQKVYKYNGFKEQVYLSSFEPNQNFFNDLAISCNLPLGWEFSKKILVTVRTPPDMAAYHRLDNLNFDKLLKILNKKQDLFVLVLPRTNAQGRIIKQNFPNLRIPKIPLDGRNLVYYSDLVISAGGTMNREAAILGTPAYTMFAGQIAEVDRRLIEADRIIPILERKDFYKIQLKKKEKKEPLKNTELIAEIIDEIY